MRSGAGEQLYKLKIAALLHDPPHKPWLENHEEVAEKWITQLTGSSIPKEVREADKLASSIDRYLLSLVIGEKYIPGFLPCKEVKLKNTVNPQFVQSIEPCDAKVAEDYFGELSKILKGLDYKRMYFALYPLYELLWIDKGLPVGPADTRVPTHTVFDHDYATATALNWVSDEGFDGYILGIDVAGVQDFVASSRKLRDTWMSSYLVSLFAWYALLHFIKEWGPDVVVIPSLRGNPFFLHWAAKKLAGGAGERLMGLAKRYVYLSKELQHQYEALGMPPFAAFPEKAVLALPPQAAKNGDECEKLLQERLNSGWRKLWVAARELARVCADGDKRKLTWRLIHRVFEYYEREFKDAGFDAQAPLLLRVHLQRIDGSKDTWRIYDDAYSRLAGAFQGMKRVRVDARAKLKLHELTRKAFGGGLGYPKISSRGYDYCTMCGTLPALVILPPDESSGYSEFAFYIYKTVEEGVSPEGASVAWRERRPSEMQKFEEWLKRNAREIEDLKVAFTPGERLCPWCFLRRVLSLEPRLLRVLLEDADVKGVVSELKDSSTSFSFPSVSDVAAYRLKEELVSAVRRVEDKEKILELLNTALEKSVGKGWEQMRIQALSPLWPAQKRLDKEAESIEEHLEASPLLRLIVRLDPESLWFKTDPSTRTLWRKTFREMGVEKWSWTYYALILADGDSIGDLLDGKVSAFFGAAWDDIRQAKVSGVKKEDVVSLKKRLIENSAEGEFGELLRGALGALESSMKDKWIEEWAKHLTSRYGKGEISEEDMRQRLNKLLERLGEIIDEEDKLPLSFTYHSALSAALVRAALLDAAAITELGGCVVYAGGDDLLAFAPVHQAMRIATCTRAHFAGTCRDKHSFDNVKIRGGFVTINQASMPALPGVGRSYAINIAHYLYPLQLVLGDARRAIGQAKAGACACYWDPIVKRLLYVYKDLVAVIFSPRGGGYSTLIPCTLARAVYVEPARYLELVAEPLESVNKILEHLEPLSAHPSVFSTSLLYDVEGYAELLAGIATKASLENQLSIKLIERIIERNINVKDLRLKVQQILHDVLGKLADLLSASIVCEPDPIDGKDKKTHLFVSIVRGARLIRGGMRA
ncbi:MAG: type III-B CRISPR-associated protein Cas10/Cmr2 [Thermofilum sp.]|jgi:CRISPR-associated protein Cmr2|nr:type III-B CRISPR-associated protein Cas10/Cmr2 [Thermofilum sp.]